MKSKKIVIGNWKMNQGLSEIESFFKEFLATAALGETEIGFAPQFIHLANLITKLKSTQIKIGAQNCSNFASGAYTGEVSPKNLKEIGCNFTLIGHSERRALFNESHEVLNQKATLALKEGLRVVFCVGESLSEREENKAEKIVEEQILLGLKNFKSTDFDHIVIAYEPVWAIGTGKTATPDDANNMHKFIKKLVKSKFGVNEDKLSVLYGGSVKAGNAKELFGMSHIDGGLVGGASLNPGEFLNICKA